MPVGGARTYETSRRFNDRSHDGAVRAVSPSGQRHEMASAPSAPVGTDSWRAAASQSILEPAAREASLPPRKVYGSPLNRDATAALAGGGGTTNGAGAGAGAQAQGLGSIRVCNSASPGIRAMAPTALAVRPDTAGGRVVHGGGRGASNWSDLTFRSTSCTAAATARALLDLDPRGHMHRTLTCHLAPHVRRSREAHTDPVSQERVWHGKRTEFSAAVRRHGLGTRRPVINITAEARPTVYFPSAAGPYNLLNNSI